MGNLDPGEAAYRAHMHAIAIKGGEATKQRHGSDPKRNYYREIGRDGGTASAAARRERFRQQAETEADGCALTPAVLAEPLPAPRKPTIADELARLGLDCEPDPTGARGHLLLGRSEPAAAAAVSRK